VVVCVAVKAVVVIASGGHVVAVAGGGVVAVPLLLAGHRLLKRAAHHPSILLRWRVLVGLEPVLVDDPVGLAAVGRPAAVEDERLPHPDDADDGARTRGRRRRQHGLVPAGGLPEAGGGGAVGARAAGVLAVLVAEEVVLRRLLFLRAGTGGTTVVAAPLCNGQGFNSSLSIYDGASACFEKRFQQHISYIYIYIVT
jgi:hypothetical protein